MRFSQHHHFVNLSRVSPLKLHTVFSAHDNTKSLLHANQRMAICFSPILVVESHLITPSDRGLRNKFIKGTLHEQEMQRLVGATCMAFGHGPILHAQIDRDSMIFSTLGNWRTGMFIFWNVWLRVIKPKSQIPNRMVLPLPVIYAIAVFSVNPQRRLVVV